MDMQPPMNPLDEPFYFSIRAEKCKPFFSAFLHKLFDEFFAPVFVRKSQWGSLLRMFLLSFIIQEAPVRNLTVK